MNWSVQGMEITIGPSLTEPTHVSNGDGENHLSGIEWGPHMYRLLLHLPRVVLGSSIGEAVKTGAMSGTS